jgi:replicative DNA helicase
MIKVLPQAIESEKTVLGAILIEKEAIHQVSDLLKPEMFYHSFHQFLYENLIGMQLKGMPIDLVTIIQTLTDRGELEKAGGNHYVLTLTNNVVSSAHITSHAKTILSKYLLREQIRIGGELQVKAYEEKADPFENQEQAEKDLHELASSVNQTESRHISSLLINVFKEIDSLRNREHFLIGTTSGYQSVDKLTMGWQKSDLIIIAARPAVGKTAFTLSLAVQAALHETPSAFFSLEMSGEQLTKRILASQAKMYLSTIKGARLSDEQMQHLFSNGIQPLSGIPFYVDDTASLSVAQFKARLRRLVRTKGVRIAFVDYLQLLKSSLGKNINRQQQIGEISRELKITAKELNIPIIALSQLSREVEKRKSGAPQLSDIREAGDIEQDADMVMFLYGHSEEDIKRDMNLTNEIYLKVSKHRNGALDTIKFNYDKDYQIFTDEGFGELRFIKQPSFINDDNPF